MATSLLDKTMTKWLFPVTLSDVMRFFPFVQPEIANPALLMGESIIRMGGFDRLPCQLLIDGRMERMGGDISRSEPMSVVDVNSGGGGGGASSYEIFNEEVDSVCRTLLPAQGALFVTNYRVIFIGVPKDPFRKF